MVGVLLISSLGISVKILYQTNWRDRKTYTHVVSAITVIIILIIIIASSSSNYCQRKSRETFVNRWCCCNVLRDCAGQCTSGSPYCTRHRWSWRTPGRVELFLRRARFFSSFWWRFTSAVVITSFFDRLQQARWHVASSKSFGWISQALTSRLLASLNRRTRRPTFLTPVFNCPYRNSLGMRPSSIRWTCPSHHWDWSTCWGFQYVTAFHC